MKYDRKDWCIFMSQYLVPEQIERNTPRPIYLQIYEQLKRELVLGSYQPGDRFYSYRKLKGVYKTELRTIGSAIDLLIADGLLEKRATSGIYVTGQNRFSEVGNVWYAVLTEQSYHPFFFNILLGLVNEADRYGLRVAVRIGKDHEEFLRWFHPRPGEGLILTGELDDSIVKAAGAKCNNNVVVVGNYDLHGDFGNVTTNYYSKLKEALRIAFQHSCRRFALITGPKEYPISRSLCEAVSDFAAECGGVCAYADDPAENGYSAMNRLKEFRPDCVLLTEPAFAGAWEFMVEQHLKCPDDIFLIRYGKEHNDNSLAHRAAVDISGNSVIHGRTALQMLLKNRKDVIKVDFELNLNLKRENEAHA